MSAWPIVELNQLCSPVKRHEDPVPGKIYKQLGVRLWGNGTYERESVDGSDTRYKFLNRVEHNDIVVNKIWARNGSVAVAKNIYAGFYVSSEFPLYEIKCNIVLPEWISFITKWKGFWESCDEKARGSSGKNRIKPQQFLAIKIPLPSLSEQQTIVARLDALADKIQQVERHLADADAKAEHLLALRFQKIIKDAPYKTMQEVAPLMRREVIIDQDQNYTELGIRSFYKGAFHRRTQIGSEYSWQKLYYVKKDDIIFSNIMAWEQAIALAKAEDDGCVGNHRMLTCEANSLTVLPSFLFYYFTTKGGFAKIEAASPGTAARNKTLKSDVLMTIEVPVPPLAAQQSFVQLQTYVAELKFRHDMIRASLAKLMPAVLERTFGEQAQLSAQPATQPPARQQPQSPAILSFFPNANRLHDKAAVASYITMQCHGSDFGKTKLAKCYYLLHERLGLCLTEEFRREAAGPWDKEQDEFLAYASQQGWLELPPEKHLPANASKGERAFKAVVRGKECKQGANEALKLFGAHQTTADALLREMKKMHWELLELWATSLDAAKALQAQGEVVTAQTVRDFIASVPKWVEHKLEKKPQHYTVQSIENALAALRKWQLLVN